MPMAISVATAKLAIRVTKPQPRNRFICHHINRPEVPQKTIATDITSTAMAQNQRASTRQDR